MYVQCVCHFSPSRPPTGHGRRRDSTPAMVKMFEGGGGEQQTSSTPPSEGGELLEGEGFGGEEAHLPWERRGRRQMPVTLDNGEAQPPQVETHTSVTRLQPTPDTEGPLPAFSSSNSASDGAVPARRSTSTREESQLEIQSLGKHKEEVERYAKEVDDLKLVLRAKDTELQKISGLRKEHASLQEEAASCKKSLFEAKSALEKAVSEAETLSEREKLAFHKAKEAEEAKTKAEEERDEIKSRLFQLEATQHKATVVLQGEIDCLKLKVSMSGP